jgi:hypothetical protein
MGKPVVALVIAMVFSNVTSIQPVPDPYRAIKIEEVFSELFIRDGKDRVYSGQIKSEKGLDEFRKSYEVKWDPKSIDFEKQMFIFGITDDISTQAFQLLKQDKIRSFVLDYIDTGIMYKLRIPEKGKKYSYLQVFILNRIDDISHVKVKNLVSNGLSKQYE